MTGTVVSIWTTTSKGQPMIERDEVQAIEGKGLDQDRYALGSGYYSGDKIWDANVTLIAEEAIQAANEGDLPELGPACLRRNIVTRGVDLESLLEKEFRIGTAVLRATKLWPPCKYIDGMHPDTDLLKRFAHSAGIGATVVAAGVIRPHDTIQLV